MDNKKKVFAELAPRYWALGYSVIPIEPGTKRPAKEIKNWSGYCNNIPNEATREAWLMRYADYGIGLLLGKEIADGYRIGAIDVDCDDFVAVVEVMGPFALCAAMEPSSAFSLWATHPWQCAAAAKFGVTGC